MSNKRSHEELGYESTVPKRKLEEMQLLSQNESQQQQQQQQQQSQSQSQSQPQKSLHRQSSAQDMNGHNTKSTNKKFNNELEELMDCETQELLTNESTTVGMGDTQSTGVVESEEEEDDYDTEPDIIIPYLNRFQESYKSSLSIYSSRLDKLELSDALKCTNDLFAVAIDNYQKEHNGFAHKTQMDLSGVHNVRREFDLLLNGSHNYHKYSPQSSNTNLNNNTNNFNNNYQNNSYNKINTNITTNTNSYSNLLSNTTSYYCFDDKLAKVIAFMCQIENKICLDMKQIYISYEKLLEDLIMIEYRLSIIIEMFHHMTDIEPQKFLPSLPFIQNVPDLIGYINSLYDEDNDCTIKDESSNERMQAIVNQFRAMHKRIRDAMDGLHALSCIIMEKKTEVIDRVHTFYKKAEQIFFSQPSFMFQTKDSTSRCL